MSDKANAAAKHVTAARYRTLNINISDNINRVARCKAYFRTAVDNFNIFGRY